MDAMDAAAPAAVTAALVGAVAAAAGDPAAEAAHDRDYVAQIYEELTRELMVAEQEIIAECDHHPFSSNRFACVPPLMVSAILARLRETHTSK